MYFTKSNFCDIRNQMRSGNALNLGDEDDLADYDHNHLNCYSSHNYDYRV